MIDDIFATAGTAAALDAGIGVVWWAMHPPGDYVLTVLDYRISEIPGISSDWIGDFFKRSAELVATHKPIHPGCHLRVEHPGLINVLKRADEAFCDTQAAGAINRDAFDIKPITSYESAKWKPTLDERMAELSPLVKSGRVIRPAAGLPWFNWRARKLNHLKDQVERHRPGDAASAGELLQAFVLGVLLATTPKSKSFLELVGSWSDGGGATPPSEGPFGLGYISGRRPL